MSGFGGGFRLAYGTANGSLAIGSRNGIGFAQGIRDGGVALLVGQRQRSLPGVLDGSNAVGSGGSARGSYRLGDSGRQRRFSRALGLTHSLRNGVTRRDFGSGLGLADGQRNGFRPRGLCLGDGIRNGGVPCPFGAKFD